MPPINIKTLSHIEYLALLERLRRRLVELFSPEKLKNDKYFQERLQERKLPGKKPYLNFREILRCHSINDFGVVDAPQYYNLLEKAVKAAAIKIPNLNTWRVAGYDRVYFN
jgi:hypothetical protein